MDYSFSYFRFLGHKRESHILQSVGELSQNKYSQWVCVCVCVCVYSSMLIPISCENFAPYRVSFGYRIWLKTDHLVESFLQESRKQELRKIGRREASE